VNLSVDGKEAADIGDWEYTWCRLMPGEHVFRAEWGIAEKPLFEGGNFEAKTVTLRVEPNTLYFLCYSIQDDGQKPGILESSGLLGKALSRSHVTSVSFHSEDEQGALGEIRGCSLRESSLQE
jgi:hypothetical protein